MHHIDRTSFEMNDEAFADGEFGDPELPGGTFDRPFSEAELDELALEVLQVQDEQELDQFLGTLLGKAARAVGKFVRSPAGVTLKGILKDALTTAVPGLGVVTRLAPALGVGANIGAAIKGELEWEGGPDGNQDVDAVKKVIAVGADAAQQVATMPPNAPTQAVADAVQNAAVAQGVATPPPADTGAPTGSLPTSGQWYRRGRTIVLVGL